MTSKYLGTADIVVCGKLVTLKYDWGTISEIITKYGNSIFSNIFQATPLQIAEIIAIGAKGSGIDAGMIVTESPPIMPLIRAVDTAITYAYFGSDGPSLDDGSKKKSKEPKTE